MNSFEAFRAMHYAPAPGSLPICGARGKVRKSNNWDSVTCSECQMRKPQD